jgi:hypothetical protein
MSQMTATARPLRAPRRTGPAPLRVIPQRITSTGNGAFAGLCVVLLVAGLIALLLLNTALAQGSLVLGQLQRESGTLTDTENNLREAIAYDSASSTLAATATKMGMVRSNTRAYIDLSKGTVSGTAYPATTYQKYTVVTRATPPPRLTDTDSEGLQKAGASVLATVQPTVTAADRAAAKRAAEAKATAAKAAAAKKAATAKKAADAKAASKKAADAKATGSGATR